MNIEASNSRNTPTYLSHYDMQRPPFANQAENDMYFSDALLTQRLDLLLHLTQYGHELLLVTAEEGGGKTSMLNQFIQRAYSNWQIGHIIGASSTNQEQLIKQIYRQFMLQDDPHKKVISTKGLNDHMEAFLMTNHRVVLLIDDAHTLPLEALALLLDLSSMTNINKFSLQIILFCHPQIKVKLATPELEKKRFLKQRKIDLPKLTITQTDQLIQHRVELTGLRGSKIFPLSTVERIFKTSKGNPNKICEIAHQILTDSTPKERHSFFNLNYILHPPLPRMTNSIAITAVGILIVGILYFQDTINAIYQDESKLASSQGENQQV
ncbi:MAG: AAA family ATPase, partial [Thiohalomonadales bacterium]